MIMMNNNLRIFIQVAERGSFTQVANELYISQPAISRAIKALEDELKMDFNDETYASRVGDRIRKIRTEKGLSQAELGARIGLSGDRVQKYENGVRKPRTDVVKKIAAALGVSTLALADPVTTNYISAMFAMFELVDTFNMKLEESGENEAPAMRLSVNFRNQLYNYMKEWYEVYSNMQAQLETAANEEEANEIRKAYHNWQWTFPKGLVDKTEKGLQKARLKRKIEELQEAYDKLEEELNQ